jgi:hypothetical protein
VKHILLVAIAVAAGCSFSPDKVDNDLSGAGGGGDDLGGVGDDLASADMTMICAPGGKSCSNGTLSTCNLDGTGVDTTTCTLGCNAAANDCAALQPTAPAVAGDFVYGGLSELSIGATQTLLVFDTDTGEIRDGSGAVVRMPNATPMSRNVEDGIGFHNVSGVGIWTFSKLTVPATTTIVFKNPSAASILSAGDLTIAGTIDARGYADPTKALMPGAASTLCGGATSIAGPGGTIGGLTTTAPAGEGGTVADATKGGGGGGYGAVGGIGGNHGGGTGGTAGTVAGSAAINPLAGGLGGGSSGSFGGGGGGAVQLAAEGTLTISGTINAGGCGGSAGDATHGGAGGGSGGAILVESPTVHVAAAAILAANGGGGGGGGDAAATAGQPGRSSATVANSGSGAAGGQNGGNGGAGSTAAQPGIDGSGAGGGGGGVGRVRLNSSSGSATLDGGSTLSPAASQGAVVIQ